MRYRILYILIFSFSLFAVPITFAKDQSFYDRIDFSNTDFEGLIRNKGKGEYKIRTVQPISIDEDNGDTIFLQGMVGNFSQFGKYRLGTNLGIGNRIFSDDFTKMYGYNFFYDSEPDPGHHRIGAGLEYKQSKFGISNNYYKAVSGKRAYGAASLDEEVLDGVDIIISGLVPKLYWIETDLSYAHWNSVASSDLNELKLGFGFNINDYLSINLQAEHDNLNSISYNAGISFNVGGKKSHKPSLLGSNQGAPVEDMRVYNLEPVKRSEKITLEQSGGFTVKIKKSG